MLYPNFQRHLVKTVKHDHRRETHAFGVKPPVKGNKIRSGHH